MSLVKKGETYKDHLSWVLHSFNRNGRYTDQDGITHFKDGGVFYVDDSGVNHYYYASKEYECNNCNY